MYTCNAAHGLSPGLDAFASEEVDAFTKATLDGAEMEEFKTGRVRDSQCEKLWRNCFELFSIWKRPRS